MHLYRSDMKYYKYKTVMVVMFSSSVSCSSVLTSPLSSYVLYLCIIIFLAVK